MRVGVVGGGIIGLVLSYELCRIGKDVTLFEKKSNIGKGVSSIAIGGITPFSDDFISERLGDSAEDVLTCFDDFLIDLRNNGGLIKTIDKGVIYGAFNELELHRLTNSFSDMFPFQLRPKPLTTKQVRNLESSISPQVIGGVLVDCEIALDPKQLIHELYQFLHHQNSFNCLFKTEVSSISDDGVIKFELNDEIKSKKFDYVVICSGLNNEVHGLDKWKMQGVKGQAIDCVMPNGFSHGLKHHIYSHIDEPENLCCSAYIVPRDERNVTIGVTYEDDFIQTEPDLKGVQAIIDGVGKLVPSSKNWLFRSAQAGLRPVSNDSGPLVGFRNNSGKVLVSIGHYGLGVTLAPYSAKIITNYLGLSKKIPAGASNFCPSRKINYTHRI